METGDTTEQFKNENPQKNKVHKVLAHSYLFYFISLLIGLSFDFAFPLKIFRETTLTPLGILFLALGTFLILWAQKSSLKLRKEDITKESFSHGPYHYTRSPTHFGLFLLILGFGFTVNALFIIIFSIISLFVTKFIFLKKEEKILAEKYGAPYLEYKKSVKF
jgi:protein-S-isoprenylcysteine O-methyltransferase Ste14